MNEYRVRSKPPNWKELIGGEKTKVEPDHVPTQGWVLLREYDGGVFTAPIVDETRFWPHQYEPGPTGYCECGCFMGRSHSTGPVDPFGPCPAKPRTKIEVVVFRLLRWLRLWRPPKSPIVEMTEKIVERARRAEASSDRQATQLD